MTTLKFTVDSALLGELGERLVEKVHYALVELVKNSYDADARHVTVKFIENDSGINEIHIIDDGVGMNFADVQAYWMHIATTNKLSSDVSQKYGRPKTGSKGIGRFCCRRLGKKLTLITTGKSGNKYEKTDVTFRWVDFKPGTKVTDIECKGNQQTFKTGETGTTLIISELADEWSTRGYNYLKRQLAVLAANRGARRSGFNEDPGFNILLEAPGFEGEIRDLRADLIKAGWGTLRASISKSHKAVYELDALRIGKRTIVAEKRFTHLSDIKLEIGIMILEKDRMRDTSLVSMGTLNEILPEWGGVQIRSKGFRVYPYGDDDWLNIDEDRSYRRGTPSNELQAFAATLRGVNPQRALLNLASMKNYIGNVEIGSEAKGFVMKANREGFLHSKEFDELVEFVRFGINWATIYYDFYLRENFREEADQSRIAFQESMGAIIESPKIVEAAVSYIDKEFKNLVSSLPAKQRQPVSKAFYNATEAIITHEQSNKEELRHLRLVASTSTLLLVFSHEIRALLGLLDDISSQIILLKKKLPEDQANKSEAISNRLKDVKDKFKDLLKMTSLFSIASQKEEPKILALRERADKTVSMFDLIRKRYSIDINSDGIQNSVMVGPIYEAELYSILLNLLSNSIKSVIAHGGVRKIYLAAIKDGKKVSLRVMDTGIGLDPNKDNRIFLPFKADQNGKLYSALEKRLNPEDKYVVGTGSGLGLSIVKEILSARNGDIKIMPPDKEWHAIMEITL